MSLNQTKAIGETWKANKEETERSFDLIEKLREDLGKLKEQEGINGYILRGSKSASIDLKDPTKIIEYAALSSTTLEVAEEIARASNLGTLNSVVLEGKNVKILSGVIGDYRFSIFMSKGVDHNRICEELNL